METSRPPRTPGLPRRLRDTRLFRKLRKAATQQHRPEAPPYCAGASDTTSWIGPVELQKTLAAAEEERETSPTPPPPYHELPHAHRRRQTYHHRGAVVQVGEVPRFRPAIHEVKPAEIRRAHSVASLGGSELSHPQFLPPRPKTNHQPSNKRTNNRNNNNHD